MNLSLIELYGTMGYFAKGIVWILALMSIYATTLGIKKGFDFRRSRKATLKFSPLLAEALEKNDFAEADRLVNEYKRSHLAAAFHSVFANLAVHVRDQALSAVEVASSQRTIELNAMEQLTRFRRGLGVLATTGATAPFVGLLGTTMGVVNAFTGMAVAGTGGLAAISAGIAEALITTAFGLFVAIPAVWLYNYFVNRIEGISMEIQYAAKEFSDFLLRYEAGLSGRTGKDSVTETLAVASRR